MELMLCLSLLIVLPGRNGNFCLGPSAVLCSTVSSWAGSQEWASPARERELCALHYQPKNALNVFANKYLIYFNSSKV